LQDRIALAFRNSSIGFAVAATVLGYIASAIGRK
jgi:hypothetical protein